MREITRGSVERLHKVDAFAMDMDGTVYLGNRLLPGAKRWKEALDRLDVPLVFLTNNSSRARSDYVDRLRGMGLDVDGNNVMTSGEATIGYLRDHHPGASVRLTGTPSLEREFAEGGVRLAPAGEDAAVAVLGFDTTLTYAKIRELCDMVRAGLPYLATHPDFNCPTEDGYLPDIGAFIALVEASTGRRPDEVIGKPNHWMVDALCTRLGIEADRIAYVGDRLYTDVAMANVSGMLGILTLTGETTLSDLDGSEFRPDLVVDGLEDLLSVFEDGGPDG